MISDFFLILLMTISGAFAAYSLKRSSGGTLLQIFCSVWFFAGGGLYLCAACLNILALKRMDYSIVLPLSSITYIWTAIISWTLLKENITKKMILGITFIVSGAVCISLAFSQ